MKHTRAIRSAAAATVVGFFAVQALGVSPTKERIAMISFGDYLEFQNDYYSKASIEQSFRKLKEAGFSAIYWRMTWEGAPHRSDRPLQQPSAAAVGGVSEGIRKYALLMG